MNHAQLIALGRALRVAGEHGQRLTADTEGEAVLNTEELRQDLERALHLLDETITTPKAITRCPEHPSGPVEPDAADLCLLCETRRRAGRRAAPQMRSAESDEPDAAARVQSRYRLRADEPEPQKRWIPEMWNGQAWQACGTPRRCEPEAQQYLAQLRQAPNPATAYRLVYAFTDHDIVRVWGTPALRQAGF
ncbi:hypothetical protein DV517_74950 [Streptomyces sp. S816]|uniref:hypothetical protein n=1 Tax=Streptomyces sp. S816 TaxID=2283197 RepID=UPI00109D5F7C|nr:hypothetical protein [Streptomyces sp. S816]TGZ12400.1 hypothetical protein DV517_74950 [Streptomyces sp. S816]